MNQDLLAQFQQAYKDLDLFPLVEAESIAKFRVDFGMEVMIRFNGSHSNCWTRNPRGNGFRSGYF